MRQEKLRRHFPTLLGYLPRMMVSLSRGPVTGISQRLPVVYHQRSRLSGSRPTECSGPQRDKLV
jgi:hypothetical protein